MECERKIPEQCIEHLNKIKDFLNEVHVFLERMKCPYAKELDSQLLEITDSLSEMTCCKKCGYDPCECILDEAVEELMNE